MVTSSTFRRDALDTGGAISLSEVISALSYALDLTEGAVHGHALRSCLLGMRIAEEVGLSCDQTSSLYYALLLKDVACSSNAGRIRELMTVNEYAFKTTGKHPAWTRPFKPNQSMLRALWETVLPDGGPGERIARMIRICTTLPKCGEEINALRSDRGASIVSKLGMGEMAAQAVRCLDERWDGGGDPARMRAEQIPLLARIVAVAQHLDIFSTGRGVQSAIDSLQQRSGTWFDPELVRVAISLHRREVLWTHCTINDNNEDIRRAVLDLDPGRTKYLQAAEIDRICEAFADVVDAKSHFTFSHSMGVADAAFGIAQGIGLSAERVQLVRRAALLHDIGKLSVSNSILDKRTQLSAEEWYSVRQHPGHTRSILERVGPFREIAIIAGEHHEKLDGSGYPNRLMAPDLSLEARIIAVADVYGALSEDRPYRAGLDLDEIVTIMKRLAPHKLDADCVEALVTAISGGSELAFTPGMDAGASPIIFAAI
jgi:putative nucleotidyltransferase with HDIG domain